MNTKRSILSTLSCLLFFCLVANASAGDVLKCEKRTKNPRSKISVEVENLVSGAVYAASVSSGLNSASALQAADSVGVAEFDFDSKQKDILAGATPITPGFIDGDVTAIVTDASGGVVLNTSATCKIRK